MERGLFTLAILSLMAMIISASSVRAEMKMEPEATHHLSVHLEDEKTGEKIKEAEVRYTVTIPFTVL